MKNNYGLVLEGGGAKGAYHIGAYFALMELGFEFKSVVGTSIGAINAAMIAMKEPDKCAELWRNTSMDSYIDRDREKEINEILDKNKINRDENVFDVLKRKAIERIEGATIDIEPVRNLVEFNIDEDKVRNSDMNFGLVTFNLTDKRGEELFIKDIAYGKLHNYLIASCYLPVFKLEPLDGKYYLDGGFYNNLPYNMVEKLGQTPVIIRTRPSRPARIRDLNIPDDAIVIEPRKVYVSSMDFDPIKAEKLMRIGYFDSYKKLKGLLGEKYYIKPFAEDRALIIMKDLLDTVLSEYLNEEDFKKVSEHKRFFEEFLPKIAKKYELADNYTYVKILTIILEKIAEELKIDYLRIYEPEELLDEIRKRKTKSDDKNMNIIEKFIVDIVRGHWIENKWYKRSF